MVAAAYTSDLTDIYLFEVTTNVIAYGGGGAGLAASPDFAMEGTNAVDKQITAADKGLMYSLMSVTPGPDDHFYVWIMVGTPGLMDSRDNGGMVVAIGDDGSNLVKFHVQGNDTYPLGGGDPYVVRFVNTALTNLRTLVGTPGTTPDHIGGGLNTTASVMGSNLGVDAARYGWGYEITGGTGADAPADWAGLVADDESTSEGVFQFLRPPAGYKLQGKIYLGTAASACRFTDSEFLIAATDTLHSLQDFTEILIEHADTEVTLTNGTFIGLGTTNPGRFRVLDTGALNSLTNITFQDWGPTMLGSGTTALGSRWINCPIIEPTNADYGGFQTLDGTGDYLSTSAAVSHTFVNGDFEIILRAASTDWSPTAQETFFHWDEAGNDSIMLYTNASNDLLLDIEAGGTTTTLTDATILDNLTDTEWAALRVFYDASLGQAFFYYSFDVKDINARDITWTAGASPTGTSRTITTLNGTAYIGADSAGANEFTGDISYLSIWDGATTAELQIMLADWRWGPDFTGTPPARADGIQSVNWDENGNPVYTLGDNRSGAASFTDSDIIDSPSHAGLLWDVNTDPNGELDGMTHESLSNHAIEFGKNSPATVTLTDNTFTGFNAANGNADSTFYNNTGGALTITVSGASGNTSYRNGVGASTTVTQSVTVTINVSGTGFGVIQGASVRVEETDGTLVSQGTTNASGVYSFSYTGSTPLAVNTLVRLKGWKIPPPTGGTIVGGTGLTANFTLTADPTVNLP
jgi:hypothetical protein